eukprot:scaffold625138_cov19-Prasinocladus_malaysianus.AAC.1
MGTRSQTCNWQIPIHVATKQVQNWVQRQRLKIMCAKPSCIIDPTEPEYTKLWFQAGTAWACFATTN